MCVVDVFIHSLSGPMCFWSSVRGRLRFDLVNCCLSSRLVVFFYQSRNRSLPVNWFVAYAENGVFPLSDSSGFHLGFFSLLHFNFDVVAKINFCLIKWLLSSSVAALATHLLTATGENNRITPSQVDLPSFATSALLSFSCCCGGCCCCRSYLPSSFDRYQIRCPSSACHTLVRVTTFSGRLVANGSCWCHCSTASSTALLLNNRLSACLSTSFLVHFAIELNWREGVVNDSDCFK